MHLTEKPPYQTKSAVLFLIFNRPDTTLKVFEQIRIAKPSRLYVAADAPRQGISSDVQLCKQTRAIVKNIDWECEVKTLFNKKNAGCRDGVSAAITWFFDNEEEGIILEDDCLPANSFFEFCDTLLEKYRSDTRISILPAVIYSREKNGAIAAIIFQTGLMFGAGQAGRGYGRIMI
jgi:hypothetical protein